MIQSEFVIRDNKILSFSLKGHSGLAEAGSDVLCASVSAMALLVINTLSDAMDARLDLQIEEKEPRISCTVLSVPSEGARGAEGILHGFYLQMKDLSETYPDHLTVRTKTK